MVDLEALQSWFMSREGYYHAEIKDDPSSTNKNRKTLYVHGTLDWKITSDSCIPVFMGTAYMSKWVVKEINNVTHKIGELYD